MQLIKDKSKLPVPQVFAYKVDENNPIGVPYFLMEFILGNTAMDAAGGYEVHKGQIPLAHRQSFYRSVAECHVQMTALRFPKIGTIVRSKDSEYDTGPFPDIGGPFNTATASFEAWAEHARFPRGKDEILQMMEGGLAKQVLTAINDFPSQIKAMASRLSCNDDGPFPLCHADFLHSNIIIDESFEVIGVIDWEGACTLPWELITFPIFLSAMPVPFDSPKNYDKDRQPIDDETKQRWKDRQDYVQMVKSAEHKDCILSACLSDKKRLDFAYSMKAYSTGKLGFYDKVMDEQDGAE